MDLSEIRLGNWFHHKDDWSYRQPEQDFKEFDFQWNQSDWYAVGECTLPVECIEPIKLTTDWLQRVDWGGYNDLYLNSNFCLDDVGHLYYRSDYTGINVEYVHQLQNLFFALTGRELELKK